MSLQLRRNSFLCGNLHPNQLLFATTSSCLAIYAVIGLHKSAIANPIHLDGSTPLSALSSPDCGAVDCTITSGMTGDHVFHSFDAFNIEEGVTVTFEAPSNVERIFSRLGRSNPGSGNEARIAGTLAVSGSADLFLLSPDGIQILPTGRIVSGGSFIGTTARSLEFADGSFLTGTTAAPPVLSSSSIPLYLNFANRGRDIEVEGNNSNSLWQSRNGGTLALLGGNTGETFVEDRTINMEQGGFVIAALEPGSLDITALPTSYTFDFAATAPNNAGTVNLKEVSVVPITPTSSGNLNIYGEDIFIEKSEIRLETGNINLNGENIDIEESSILLGTAPSSVGSGDITITSRTLTLSGSSELRTRTTAPTGGNITIQANSIDLMDLEDDNDIIVEAPTNRLSLSQAPSSPINTDPSLFARNNDLNDVGYQSLQPPTPVVTPPPVTPPVVPPPVVTPLAPPAATPSSSPPVIISEPNTPEIEPVDEAAEPERSLPSVSLWNGLSDEDEQQVTLSARSSASSSAIASLCQASRTGALLTASSPGGLPSFPQQLVGMTSLADLGSMEAPRGEPSRSQFDQLRLTNLVSHSPVITHNTIYKGHKDVSTTKAIRERLLSKASQTVEAISWNRSKTGQLHLIALGNTLQPPEFSVSCRAS